MKIGIVSDTHDRLDTTEVALRLLRAEGVELVLHCGDITSADTVRLFAGVPTHFVWGNNDKEWYSEGDRPLLRSAIAEVGATIHEPFGHLELAGKQIAWLHGDDTHLLRDLIRAEAFDYLFHGHTHVADQHREGRTLVANPGALHRAKPKTCAVLDPATGELEWLTVG